VHHTDKFKSSDKVNLAEFNPFNDDIYVGCGSRYHQGCQIFLGTACQNWAKYTKMTLK
jgi:hypothetical protein